MSRKWDIDSILATTQYDKILDISATSVALLLSAITDMQYRNRWLVSGVEPNDVEWDSINAMVSLASYELMSSLVGSIWLSAVATYSAFKFLPCDGQVYNKDDYPLLYDALDNAYIVSGTQFRTPDLRDRVPVGTGNNYSLDDSGGVDSVALSVAELPAHTHSYNQYTFGIDIESVGVPDPTGVGQPALPQNTSSVGSNQAHENRQPYLALDFVIVAG